MADIFILSLNVNSLQSVAKRHDILNFGCGKRLSIIFLQETNCAGVMILIKNNFEYTIHKNINDKNDLYIILDITVKKYYLTLVNLYGPNSTTPHHFENLHLLENLPGLIIMAGDRSVVQNY